MTSTHGFVCLRNLAFRLNLHPGCHPIRYFYQMRPADVQILHNSDFYQVRNYKCNCIECHRSAVEYCRTFNICFVRSGYFEFEVFRHNHEVHVGRVLITKPGTEHIARHIDAQPDVCSVFDFKDEFYRSMQEHYRYDIRWFFENNEIDSMMLKCSAEIDYLHHRIISSFPAAGQDRLQIDELVLRLVDSVMRTVGNCDEPSPLSSSLKAFHLGTVEKAKNYILTHFEQNISLQQLSDHCCVSLFHFSRVFKAVMKMSPHQYLSEIRLNHAKILLESTQDAVSSIAMQCGYNSLEHFASAYKMRYRSTPSAYRLSRAN